MTEEEKLSYHKLENVSDSSDSSVDSDMELLEKPNEKWVIISKLDVEMFFLHFLHSESLLAHSY